MDAMKLPPISDPWRYEGLFVFDFGEWVSVGYTAEEVAVLLESKEHRNGAAYRVYRVNAQGGMELIAVRGGELYGEEMMLFASRDSLEAQAGFSSLKEAAQQSPIGCAARIEMIDVALEEHPHGVCLIYPRHAGNIVSAWLVAMAFQGGEVVLGGAEALNAYNGAKAAPVASCRLVARADYTPRLADEILRSVRRPLQR
jgi:hypothetical protein